MSAVSAVRCCRRGYGDASPDSGNAVWLMSLLRAVSERGQSGYDFHLGQTIERIPKTPAQVGMD